MNNTESSTNSDESLANSECQHESDGSGYGHGDGMDCDVKAWVKCRDKLREEL